MTTATLSLVSGDTSVLPSQEGKRGRPRVAGRATVTGAGLVRKEVQAAVAALHGRQSSEIVFYTRESDDSRLTFVVPGIPKDERVNYTLAEAEAPAEAAETPASE